MNPVLSVVGFEQSEAMRILADEGLRVGHVAVTGPSGTELRVVRQIVRPEGAVDLVVAVRRSNPRE